MEIENEPVQSKPKTRNQYLIRLFNRILPPYEPRIEINEKLLTNEQIADHAIIRHFSEIQLLIGIMLIFSGFILRIVIHSGYLYFLAVLGIVLFFSSYEMEEIYITSHRIMIRRVGMIERIMRVPSDEDHTVDHLVSYQVGRAPVNILLVFTAGMGFLVIFNNIIADWVQLVILLSASVILAFGLRINRRAVTLNLAGGLSILLGVRKGVPKHLISAIQTAMYENERLYELQQNQEDDFDYDTEPAKSI